MGLTAVDVDRDWALFDNVRKVTVELRGADDSFAAAQVVDALELPREVGQDAAGDGAVLTKTRRLALRALQLTGDPVKGTRITDWAGRVFFVEGTARLVSWGTRWQVDLRV